MSKYQERLEDSILDYNYICSKWVKGHGASFSYNAYDGTLHINYIYGKNKLQILAYNMILKLRYLRRKYEQKRKV